MTVESFSLFDKKAAAEAEEELYLYNLSIFNRHLFSIYFSFLPPTLWLKCKYFIQ